MRRDELSQGTAFALAEPNLWLTASHIVKPCLAGRFRGSINGSTINGLRLSGANDTAVAAATAPMGHPLPLGRFEPGQPAETQGVIVGYPGQSLAAVRIIWIGTGFAMASERPARPEHISVWVEMERSPSGSYDLGGMSGGPVIDGNGQVIGVLSAEVPRRGRLLVAPVEEWIATSGRTSGLPIVPTGQEAASLTDFSRKLTNQKLIARLFCDLG